MLSIWLDRSPVPAARLYRGGELDPFMGPELAAPARTLISLRAGADAPWAGVHMVHLPAPMGLDRYHTPTQARADVGAQLARARGRSIDFLARILALRELTQPYPGSTSMTRRLRNTNRLWPRNGVRVQMIRFRRCSRTFAMLRLG